MNRVCELPCVHNRQLFADYASKTLPGELGNILPMPSRPKSGARLPEDSAVGTFAQNVRMLVEQRQAAQPHLTKDDIARSLDLSLRSLSNARSGAHVPRLDAVDKVAREFKLSPWQLLLPDLPAEVLFNPELRRSMQLLLESDPEDRKAVERLLSKKQKTA